MAEDIEEVKTPIEKVLSFDFVSDKVKSAIKSMLPEENVEPATVAVVEKTIESKIALLEKKIKAIKISAQYIRDAKKKKEAEDLLGVYEKIYNKLISKKERGGEMTIETQHSFGDPKENNEAKIDLSFSAQDPNYEKGGSFDGFGESGIVEIKPIHASREDVDELERWLNENEYKFERASTALSRSRNELPYFQVNTTNLKSEELSYLHSYLERKHWSWVNLYANGGAINNASPEAGKVGEIVAKRIFK